jgi:hypothetical protein
MANTTLNVTSLDRAALRTDLIAFLRSQSEFADYDFAGSNLSVLIDLLTYNTNKMAWLTNMLFSEAFQDSAQLMSSVVSHAKELNYTPRSSRSSQATVTVTFTSSGENQPYVIPKGASFSTLVKNTQYVFSIPEALVVSSANSSFSFTTPILEGEYFKDGYAYAPTEDDPHPSFRITNPNVDTSSITVVVFEDDATVGDTYTLATSLLDLTNLSKVYFLQATNDGYFEVLFGDGVVGKQPATGSNIVIDYRVTVGPRADSATRFAINFDPTGSFGEASNVRVTTDAISAGGGNPESIGSIKYYAPRWYQTQERATAASDYSTLMSTNFPEIQAITAYGGEDAIPPLYGRVVVSVALAGLTKLPTSRQETYRQFLEKRMPLGMRLIFVDPLYTFVDVRVVAKYDTSVTANTPRRIESLITDIITTWNEDYLGDFEVELLKSPFMRAIDAADPSIDSNSTWLRLYKKLEPIREIPTDFTLDFQCALISDLPHREYPHPTIYESVVTSTPFSYNGLNVRLEDDGLGNIFIVQDSGVNTSEIIKVGTVDYAMGIIAMKLTVDDYTGSAILLYVRAADDDLSSSKNTILSIEASGIDVRAVPK